MINSDQFCTTLDDRRIGFVTGVPCSYFSGPIAALTRARRYVPAANEGAALALAAGAAAAGARTAVIAQNSGLGNLINPLTSLAMPYGIPVLIFMSLRGWPDPAGDEPQHAVMGTATHRVLDAVGVAHWTLQRDEPSLEPILDLAEAELDAGRTAVVLCEKGAIETHRPAGVPADTPLTRTEALAVLVPRLAGHPIVSTTGYTSRELFAHHDAGSHFYMQGSMGHAGAFALGVALHADRAGPVVVLDGDGAALMHLGTISTIGACAPLPLVHVLFDNGMYESTGAQATTARTTDFAALALATGYRSARACRSAADIESALAVALSRPGPHLIAIQVAPATGQIPDRATSALSPAAIRDRFSATLRAGARTSVGGPR
jgi:phosphonopyruvate decarboxylase